MALPMERTTASEPIPARGGLREVTLLAYPVVLTQLAGTTMGVVDAAMVGRLGATELGAVGYGGIWLWTALSFFLGTTTAVQTFVAQAYGAGDRARCGAWAWQALYVVVPAMLVGIPLFVWAFDGFVRMLGPSPELGGLASVYVRTRALGAIGVGVAFASTSFFRGIGDTKTPLYVALVATSCNALLDYGLIFGNFGLPRWGVMGAGAATAVAEWIYGTVMLVLFLRRRVSRRYATGPVRPRPGDMRRFVRVGIPIGGQWVLDMISFAIFSSVVAHMGDTAMAASQTMVVLLSLSFLQAIGIQVSASTLVGQYVGARDLAAAERSYQSALKLGVALGVGIGFAFLAVPEALLRVFTDDPEVLRMGRPLVALGAAFQLFDAVGIVASGALRGAGDTRWPFAVQTALAWALGLPLAVALGVGLGGGVFGAWVGMTVYVAVLSAALLWRLRSGAWKEVRI